MMGSGRKRGLGAVLCVFLSSLGLLRLEAAEVPLSLWTDASHPDGLDLDYGMGVSWGDYDADGYIDLFSCYSGTLLHNVHGTTWEFGANLSDQLPLAERRYGGHFGDYDGDGLPDIATSPRVPLFGDDRLHLLHNLGGGANFTDVAGDPSIMDVQPYGNAETLCWADVDGDRMLDLFVPVYPGSLGPGNFFLHNTGPAPPDGQVGFVEASEVAGLDNTPGHARPEGAQFADVDFDGDVDLYSNGTLYQNVSTRGVPRFRALESAASGISIVSLDEGAMLFDYDLDGDQDIVVAYSSEGVKIWENRGDGTFFEAEPGIVDSPMSGLNLGMSAEDWDNDGDIDFTTRDVFRQNMLVEEGVRHFTVEAHSIPHADLTSATPAWGDWDKDGDLDCALGNWGTVGRLYENTLYTPATDPATKRDVRIRVVGNSPSAPRGLETEYGATAEVRVLNGTDSFRRRKFVASSHGYLNQNEYTLHFALPPDPAPFDPQEDVHFDVSVDFPGLPSAGLWRVDPHVNPVLGNINLATLGDREITVYRCGQVTIEGITHAPLPFAPKTLTTTTDGLMLPEGPGPLPDPVPAPQSDWYTGLAFKTSGAFGPVRVEEILLDGQLDDAASCAVPPTNIALWDVTDAAHPVLVSGGAAQTSSRNRRSYIPADTVLAPNRSYRLVARVTAYRPTSIVAPTTQGPVTVLGGLSFRDLVPCSGQQVASATPDAAKTSVAIRFRPANGPPDPVGPTLRLGRGFRGAPVLKWEGLPAAEYQVLRCDASTGPCAPAPVAKASENAYIDRTATSPHREIFWYLVNAVDECAAQP